MEKKNSSPPPAPADITHPFLDFANITVFRGNKKVLDSVSLKIESGEHAAILGPNGSGKSSLIRTITRENYPVLREGRRYRIFGNEIWDVRDLRYMLGIVSHELQFTFTRDVTGREAVLSGFFSSVGLFRNEITGEMRDKTDEIMDLLGIKGLAERPLSRMSTGEARRFLIARALVHSPEALILDEPTSGLDLHSQHYFRTAIRRIAESGTAVIMVTHNIHDIIPEISRVIMLKNGEIYGDGPKNEILTGNAISGLFDVPVSIREEDGWYYAVGY